MARRQICFLAQLDRWGLFGRRRPGYPPARRLVELRLDLDPLDADPALGLNGV
ncbi:hypothetical protein ACFQU1_00055 [Chelatococcus sp. GCM10030263]|uniref:hypothetical protein n=1 Tax=Chelatococcus sp. GCM10030263 TaxID=3273387 RepID=UPI003611BA9B